MLGTTTPPARVLPWSPAGSTFSSTTSTTSSSSSSSWSAADVFLYSFIFGVTAPAERRVFPDPLGVLLRLAVAAGFPAAVLFALILSIAVMTSSFVFHLAIVGQSFVSPDALSKAPRAPMTMVDAVPPAPINAQISPSSLP